MEGGLLFGFWTVLNIMIRSFYFLRYGIHPVYYIKSDRRLIIMGGKEYSVGGMAWH